jgi:hypothetical protein
MAQLSGDLSWIISSLQGAVNTDTGQPAPTYLCPAHKATQEVGSPTCPYLEGIAPTCCMMPSVSFTPHTSWILPSLR